MDNQQFYTLCPKCGKLIRAGVKFCPHCAERFVAEEKLQMVCPKCGKVAPEGEKFCSECGTAYAPKQAIAKKEQAPRATAPAPAVRETYVAPKTAPASAPVEPGTQMQGRENQEAFFAKYARNSTKGWAKWLPIFGMISAVAYLVLMIVMFVNEEVLTGVLMILDVLCIGGLSCVMHKKKEAWPFIAFAVYNGIASALAFLDMDFSNLLWLVVSIYLAVQMWKVEKAYNEYVQTGKPPEGLI